MKLKAFSLIENLISMNIIVFCLMLIALAFVKIDNYNDRNNKLLSIITIDNIETELYSSQKTIIEIIENNSMMIRKKNLLLDYKVNEKSNNLTELELKIYKNEKLIHSKKIILKNSAYYE